MDRQYSTVNSFWAGVIAEEFARNTVNQVGITPGSRNTPLTIAFSDNSDIKTISHLDERCSSFFALGEGKTNKRPSIILSTSGTATAEFHPAVLEADEAMIPLIVLTADRPGELKKTGANQTTNQRNLYGDSVRWFNSLSEPELKESKIKHLRLTINRAVEKTRKNRPGPVHLNAPFRKPLEPSDEPSSDIQTFIKKHSLAAKGRNDQTYTKLSFDNHSSNERQVQLIRESLENSEKPLLYFGPQQLRDQKNFSPWKKLSKEASIPRLADPLSGQRFLNPDEDSVPLAAYEHYIHSLPDFSSREPDLVLRIGGPSNASHNLMDFFESTEAKQILIAEDHPWPDRSLIPEVRINAHLESLARKLLNVGNTKTLGSESFTNQMTRVDRVARNELDERLQKNEPGDEIRLSRRLFKVIESDDVLFVGNSTPIRDFVEYSGLRESDYKISANRGLSGIDGLVSTSAGIGSATNSFVVSILGDVSLYHDLNGLLAYDRHNIPGCIIVVNNKGGGIFHRLPIEDFDPPFKHLIKTNHDMSFNPIADQFNLKYSFCETVDEVITNYEKSRENDQFRLIEFQTDAEKNQRNREAITMNINETVLTELT